MAALAEYHALTSPDDEPGGAVVSASSDAGVAGTLIVGGRIYPGVHGLAGELGHIPVSLDGPACGFGATGCLTTYIKTHAILDVAGLGVLVSPHDTSAALTELGHRLHTKDPLSLAALDHAGPALGAVLREVTG